jgi:hypothetical protein
MTHVKAQFSGSKSSSSFQTWTEFENVSNKEESTKDSGLNGTGLSMVTGCIT